MTIKVGVVHGRFQPFHKDHLVYALEAFKRCDFLFIGVTNPDAQEMVFQASDPKRSLDTSNPFTFWQRALLIQASLREAGVPPDKFCVVPFPLNHTELLKYYIPLDARFYMTIYDDWGRHKYTLLSSLGLDVEVMWERDLIHKGITGTSIRQRIAAGEPWETLVPKAAGDVMKEMALDTKIREIMQLEKLSLEKDGSDAESTITLFC